MHEGRDRREKRLVDLLKPLTPEEVREIATATEILTKALGFEGKT